MSAELNWPDILTALIAGNDVDSTAAAWAMEEILSGAATPAQIAGFAVALRAKGETLDELIGLVETMYAHAAPLDVPGRIVDIVGTGGDRAKTVNISTMSAVAMAGAGANVVKHGNRAASSASGSADVLEALGIRLDLPSDRIADVAAMAGITFCFAPVFHSSLRFAAVPRRELGIATTFNFLGPLTNPAKPDAMAVGVADARMAPLVAGVFARRGVDAFVFRGDDGLDEITTTTTSTVWAVDGQAGTIDESTFDPRDLGIEYSSPEALRGGDPAFNADVFHRILDGEKSPVRDAVLLNASAGLAAYEGGTGSLNERFAVAKARIEESIDGGAARKVLDRWVSATQDIAASLAK
ncbi:MAG: anthranilate phosphoribosyltransferase [Propionibacteriales bacterium]|nr:anthranilate phosphoribosyltransferase [Propionibacteriales bacterium]